MGFESQFPEQVKLDKKKKKLSCIGQFLDYLEKLSTHDKNDFQ